MSSLYMLPGVYTAANDVRLCETGAHRTEKSWTAMLSVLNLCKGISTSLQDLAVEIAACPNSDRQMLWEAAVALAMQCCAEAMTKSGHNTKRSARAAHATQTDSHPLPAVTKSLALSQILPASLEPPSTEPPCRASLVLMLPSTVSG